MPTPSPKKKTLTIEELTRLQQWARGEDRPKYPAMAYNMASSLTLLLQSGRLTGSAPLLEWLLEGSNTRTRWQRVRGMHRQSERVQAMLGRMILERLEREG